MQTMQTLHYQYLTRGKPCTNPSPQRGESARPRRSGPGPCHEHTPPYLGPPPLSRLNGSGCGDLSRESGEGIPSRQPFRGGSPWWSRSRVRRRIRGQVATSRREAQSIPGGIVLSGEDRRSVRREVGGKVPLVPTLGAIVPFRRARTCPSAACSTPWPRPHRSHLTTRRAIESL